MIVSSDHVGESVDGADIPLTPMADQYRISPYNSLQYQADKWWE